MKHLQRNAIQKNCLRSASFTVYALHKHAKIHVFFFTTYGSTLTFTHYNRCTTKNTLLLHTTEPLPTLHVTTDAPHEYTKFTLYENDDLRNLSQCSHSTLLSYGATFNIYAPQYPHYMNRFQQSLYLFRPMKLSLTFTHYKERSSD
jgi:hypothetical protein